MGAEELNEGQRIAQAIYYSIGMMTLIGILWYIFAPLPLNEEAGETLDDLHSRFDIFKAWFVNRFFANDETGVDRYDNRNERAQRSQEAGTRSEGHVPARSQEAGTALEERSVEFREREQDDDLNLTEVDAVYEWEELVKVLALVEMVDKDGTIKPLGKKEIAGLVHKRQDDVNKLIDQAREVQPKPAAQQRMIRMRDHAGERLVPAD